MPRNWKKVKGRRRKGLWIPRQVISDSICHVWHGGRKFEFITNVHPPKKIAWEQLTGKIIDDRIRPEGPLALEPMRPLKNPGPTICSQAKRAAFAALNELRRQLRARSCQYELFPEQEVASRRPR